MEITWALEDYNDWNLPFAKTVEIKSREGQTEREHRLDPNSYKMRIDPSLMFSIIFIDG